MKELPRYKCHKEVHALIIEFVARNDPDGPGIIMPADEGYDVFLVSAEYMEKHNPKAAGYYVVYDDGYESFSPAKAFEEGYTRIDESNS